MISEALSVLNGKCGGFASTTLSNQFAYLYGEFQYSDIVVILYEIIF